MKLFVLAGSFALIVGCTAMQLNKGAEKVRLTNQEPKGCEYLGEISGSQGNAISGGWTSNDNLAQGARNDLKNKAHAMGGNVVHVISHRDGQTMGQYGGSTTSSMMEGVAYSCAAE